MISGAMYLGKYRKKNRNQFLSMSSTNLVRQKASYFIFAKCIYSPKEQRVALPISPTPLSTSTNAHRNCEHRNRHSFLMVEPRIAKGAFRLALAPERFQLYFPHQNNLSTSTLRWTFNITSMRDANILACLSRFGSGLRIMLETLPKPRARNQWELLREEKSQGLQNSI